MKTLSIFWEMSLSFAVSYIRQSQDIDKVFIGSFTFIHLMSEKNHWISTQGELCGEKGIDTIKKIY